MSQSRLSIIPSRAIADPDLTATQLRVLGAIGSFTGRDQSAYPKQSTLAELLGIARETVNRAVKALAKAGYIEVKAQKRADGGQTANLYFVKLDPCDATITPPVTVGITPPVTPAITPNRTIHINDTNSNELVSAQSADTQPERKVAKKTARRGSRISDNWGPTPKDYAFATSKGLSPQEINDEADRFRNYWAAKSGRGSTKLDWEATWRNWVTSDFGPVVRKQRQAARAGGGSSVASALDRVAHQLEFGSYADAGREELHRAQAYADDSSGRGQAEIIDANGDVLASRAF